MITVTCSNCNNGKKEEVTVSDPIGSFRSNWRKRDVSIFAHPTDIHSVVTIGIGFGEGSNAYCIEPRSHYAKDIGQFGRVYE